MAPQAEEHEDIEKREVVGDDHGGSGFVQAFASMDRHGPCGIEPGIEGRPE